MRLYCDRESSDKILSSAFHLHRQAKYATLQHLEPCEVATYQYSKVSFLKLQCWLHGNKGYKQCMLTYYNCFVEAGSVMIMNSSALFSSLLSTTSKN